VTEQTSSSTASEGVASPQDLLLSVVIPVFNQEAAIVENVATIQSSIAAGLEEPFELIVVSDGSIDGTAERALEAAGGGVRVIHYDRNLGKGYAIKVGALEGRGRYIAYIDADLDLDPAWLPLFVGTAEREKLDFAIGSKRHPDSDVHYPASRRAASWLYQQLVRILFRLDVRDTQVGLKVFRREVAEQVLPLLLVKRFAFDLELLAVSRALGFGRIRELPIRLDYRFTGSGVRSQAVVRALVDTAAIFYRLRILRYYQRKRRLAGAYGWTRPRGYEPLVSVVTPDPAAVSDLDYPELELIQVAELTPAAAAEAVRNASGTVVAFLDHGELPAGNWLGATVSFLARPEVAAVVTARVAPSAGSTRERAAAGVVESRLGGGSLYFRFTPGNLRFVSDFPAPSIVVRKDDYVAAGEGPLDELTSRLVAAGRSVLYTPETVVVASPPPLFGPHLRQAFDYGRRRSGELRQRGLRALRPTTLLPLVLLVFLAIGPIAILVGGLPRTIWLAGAAAYAIAVLASGAIAALRFRGLGVGALTVVGLVARHVVYAAGLLTGLSARR
jgi:glycosyltransferase involved in cell wall biosynthesis